MIQRIKIAWRVLFPKKGNYWDKPNGCCSQCDAVLNAYLIGGYRLHDGTYSVSAASNQDGKEEIKRAWNEMYNREKLIKPIRDRNFII